MNSCHIACFTPPLPDESCYSVLCRCLVRESVSSFRFELQMFNRQRDLSRLLYQPFRFEDLSRWFDDAESRQREYLDLHSVLQYRYPALAESARRLIRYWRDCHCLAVGELKYLTRAIGFSHLPKQKLCYCNDCVDNDRKTYGETYWHLSHQLPAVVFCPIHETPIAVSDVPISSTRYELIPAEYILRKQAQKEVLRSQSPYDMNLSHDSMWMLYHGFEMDAVKLVMLMSTLGENDLTKVLKEMQRYSNSISALEYSNTEHFILLCRIIGISPQSLVAN